MAREVPESAFPRSSLAVRTLLCTLNGECVVTAGFAVGTAFRAVLACWLRAQDGRLVGCERTARRLREQGLGPR